MVRPNKGMFILLDTRLNKILMRSAVKKLCEEMRNTIIKEALIDTDITQRNSLGY